MADNKKKKKNNKKKNKVLKNKYILDIFNARKEIYNEICFRQF